MTASRRRRLRAICACAALTAAATAATAGTAAAASTLYVNRGSLVCSDNGPGTQAQPFCTIGAAASKATAGTTVLVYSGTYSEQVTPRSGAAGSPITFAAAPGATVTVTGSGRGFYLSGVSYVTIRGFNITGTGGDGIRISSGSHDDQVIGNTVSLAGKPASGSTEKGIMVSSSSDVLVQGNLVERNSDYGIYLENSTRITVTGNESRYNARGYTRAASGIRLYGTTYSTIASNRTHDNEDSGIEFYTGSSDNLAVDNVTYDNGDHGIDDFDSPRQRYISNTVYHNVTAGLNAEGSSPGMTIENNISVDNGINSPRTRSNIRVDATSVSGSRIDYNLVSVPSGQVQYIWGSSFYYSLAALQAATGQERHGIEADPLWASRSSGDFHLLSGSPAIDSADSGAPGETATDAEGNGRYDDPGTVNTGAGPRSYDDRGALERVQRSTNSPPTAVLAVSPSTGTAPLAVTADGSASSDPNGPIATYRFDFGDGAVAGPQSAAQATHTYSAAGTYTVTLTVTDSGGLSSSATAQVVVSAPGGGGGGTGGNLVGNPGFEAGLTGWNTSGSSAGVTLTRVSDAHSGAWAAQLANTAATAGSCALNDSPDWVGTTGAGPYTATMWVKAPAAGATLKLRLREYAGSTLAGSATATITLSTSWQQVTVTYTPAAPGASTLDLNAYVSSAAPGTCFLADDVSITSG
jgi:parallel beta-helix repeat protein